jgi:two-component system nitrate/nitrite sensor histidine kinase NarX
MWLGRYEDEPFDDGDRQFLATLTEIASIAVANARLFERERQTAIVEERERIAREMHDGMAQVLGVTHLRLRAMEASGDVRDLPDLHAEVSDLADLCLEAYSDVRESILGLHEASRVDRALIESLRAYVEKYSKQSGIPTTLDIDPEHEVVLPTRQQVQVLRVVQEALTNVRKHSGATAAVVTVRHDGVLCSVVISDDGHGFDLSSLPSGREGFGLHSMRERMELLGGTLTLDSAPGRGTRVVATVPSPLQFARPTEAARAGQ